MINLTYVILSFFAQEVEILEGFEFFSMIFWPIYLVWKILKISKSSKIWTPWGKKLKMTYVSLEVCTIDWSTWSGAWPTYLATPLVWNPPLTVLFYLVIKNTSKHDCIQMQFLGASILQEMEYLYWKRNLCSFWSLKQKVYVLSYFFRDIWHFQQLRIN